MSDPSSGYPPGSKIYGLQSVHGLIHGIMGGFIVAPSFAIACFVMARRFAGDPRWRGWAPYSLVTGILFVLFFSGSIVVGSLNEGGVIPWQIAGLLQRIGIIVGWVWIAFLAWRCLRE